MERIRRRHLKPSDHVVLSCHSCGQCKSCLPSHAAYCDHVWKANFAGARLDGSVGVKSHEVNGLHAHFFGQSYFASHALAHARNTVKCPGGAQLAIDSYSRSDRLIDVLLKSGLDRFWVGSENWINSMAEYAAKHVPEKTTSNGKIWSERFVGVTTQTKYHAYTVLESMRLERPRPNYRNRGENAPSFYT